MKAINLKRVIKPAAIRRLLNEFGTEIAPGLTICEPDGTILWGKRTRGDAVPIAYQQTELGVVYAERNADHVAACLSYMAQQEAEKRTLAAETLDRYKEVTLMYRLTERLASSLVVTELAELVLEEALKNLPGDAASIMILDEESGRLVKTAAIGTAGLETHRDTSPDDGIVGAVFSSGQAEIVNDVAQDPRYVPGEETVSSMMCAPLKAKGKCFGVVKISSRASLIYNASDLKLFSAVCLEAAYAIDNANLHVSKLREERIKGNLQRYVSTQLVEAIIGSHGELSLEPRRMNITILFSDIRDFTSKCENLAPETLVGHLNDYFTRMVNVIFDKHGTINKFVGDMIVALFGAPLPVDNHERNAVRAAIDMQLDLRQSADPWIQENFNTGIGINSGEVIVGNIGSHHHTDYTAIGDEVNVAARLQARARGGQIFVTESVYGLTKDDFEYRKVGSEYLKGKQRPVDVYEVVYDHEDT